MKLKKIGYAVAAFTLITAAPLSHAVYMDTFQGLTFSFDQTDSDTLNFNIAGTLEGDWASATYLGAFGLKDLGLDFSSGGDTAIVNGPGAINLAGLNSELSNSGNSIDCLSTGTPDAAICFDIDSDYFLPDAPSIDLTYIIDFSADLDISSAGPHLKIAFTDNQGIKVGSLYSENVGVPVPEPSILALMGLGLLGIGFLRRKVKT